VICGTIWKVAGRLSVCLPAVSVLYRPRPRAARPRGAEMRASAFPHAHPAELSCFLALRLRSCVFTILLGFFFKMVGGFLGQCRFGCVPHPKGLGSAVTDPLVGCRRYRAVKRRSTARLQRPTRALHATVPSGSGPARKHKAKFEPAAWSWAQMASGSGAPKHILSGEAIKFKLQRPN
jgi:hypothetical protein